MRIRPGGWRGRAARGAALLAGVGAAAGGIWALDGGQREPTTRSVGVVPAGVPEIPANSAKQERSARPSRRPRRPRRVAPVPPPRVEIPRIGVRAHVVSLGLTRDRRLEVPSNFDEAGWWSGGARPGEPGAAVIVGHVDSRSGPAVFHRLRELRRGDLVRYVGRDNVRVTFVVDHSERHLKDRFPTRKVYSRTSHPTLRLVTCTGSFNRSSGHYRSNLIVFGHRVQA